jgi:hypothetical protein
MDQMESLDLDIPSGAKSSGQGGTPVESKKGYALNTAMMTTGYNDSRADRDAQKAGHRSSLSPSILSGLMASHFIWISPSSFSVEEKRESQKHDGRLRRV